MEFTVYEIAAGVVADAVLILGALYLRGMTLHKASDAFWHALEKIWSALRSLFQISHG